MGVALIGELGGLCQDCAATNVVVLNIHKLECGCECVCSVACHQPKGTSSLFLRPSLPLSQAADCLLDTHYSNCDTIEI